MSGSSQKLFRGIKSVKSVAFSKKAAAGNDFIIVDDRAKVLADPVRAAKTLCERKYSVGADGLLILERSKSADLKMRIFNPDGSEAQMCGNGVRCLAKFAAQAKIVSATHSIETLAGRIEAQVRGDVVKAKMITPRGLKLDVSVEVEGKKYLLHLIDTGVPHVVHVTDRVNQVEVGRLGGLLRRHSRFAPEGTNVNFISIGKDASVEVRTYERGVEAETLACGTGSTAAALVAATLKGLRSPVHVKTRGGEILKVYFNKKNSGFEEVYLEGKVADCFEGRVNL